MGEGGGDIEPDRSWPYGEAAPTERDLLKRAVGDDVIGDEGTALSASPCSNLMRPISMRIASWRVPLIGDVGEAGEW